MPLWYEDSSEALRHTGENVCGSYRNTSRQHGAPSVCRNSSAMSVLGHSTAAAYVASVHMRPHRSGYQAVPGPIQQFEAGKFRSE